MNFIKQCQIVICMIAIFYTPVFAVAVEKSLEKSKPIATTSTIPTPVSITLSFAKVWYLSTETGNTTAIAKIDYTGSGKYKIKWDVSLYSDDVKTPLAIQKALYISGKTSSTINFSNIPIQNKYYYVKLAKTDGTAITSATVELNVNHKPKLVFKEGEQQCYMMDDEKCEYPYITNVEDIDGGQTIKFYKVSGPKEITVSEDGFITFDHLYNTHRTDYDGDSIEEGHCACKEDPKDYDLVLRIFDGYEYSDVVSLPVFVDSRPKDDKHKSMP